MSDLRQHDFVFGVFRPKRTDTLRAKAHAHIGRRIEFAVAWKVEEGPYTGQWALTAMETLDPPLGWVPEEDVEIEKPKPALEALREAGFVGMWADRTDIGDSSEYARQLRENAWQRGEETR